jgi:menaquinone-dependent protoporphyrinogen IX oxidase
MRISIIYSGEKRKIEKIAKELATSIQKNNHQVDLINSINNGNQPINLHKYDKVIFGCHSEGFWNKKTPNDLKNIVDNCQGLMGKDTIVFIKPPLFRKGPAIRAVMNFIEKYGALINNFAFLRNSSSAKAFGETL